MIVIIKPASLIESLALFVINAKVTVMKKFNKKQGTTIVYKEHEPLTLYKLIKLIVIAFVITLVLTECK